MEIKTINIDAFWDTEVQVWVATSDNLPGLVAEASTNEVLVEKLKIIIPELLELNLPEYLDASVSIDLDLRSRRNERLI